MYSEQHIHDNLNLRKHFWETIQQLQTHKHQSKDKQNSNDKSKIGGQNLQKQKIIEFKDQIKYLQKISQVINSQTNLINKEHENLVDLSISNREMNIWEEYQQIINLENEFQLQQQQQENIIPSDSSREHKSNSDPNIISFSQDQSVLNNNNTNQDFEQQQQQQDGLNYNNINNNSDVNYQQIFQNNDQQEKSRKTNNFIRIAYVILIIAILFLFQCVKNGNISNEQSNHKISQQFQMMEYTNQRIIYLFDIQHLIQKLDLLRDVQDEQQVQYIEQKLQKRIKQLRKAQLKLSKYETKEDHLQWYFQEGFDMVIRNTNRSIRQFTKSLVKSENITQDVLQDQALEFWDTEANFMQVDIIQYLKQEFGNFYKYFFGVQYSISHKFLYSTIFQKDKITEKQILNFILISIMAFILVRALSQKLQNSNNSIYEIIIECTSEKGIQSIIQKHKQFLEKNNTSQQDIGLKLQNNDSNIQQDNSDQIFVQYSNLNRQNQRLNTIKKILIAFILFIIILYIHFLPSSNTSKQLEQIGNYNLIYQERSVNIKKSLTMIMDYLDISENTYFPKNYNFKPSLVEALQKQQTYKNIFAEIELDLTGQLKQQYKFQDQNICQFIDSYIQKNSEKNQEFQISQNCSSLASGNLQLGLENTLQYINEFLENKWLELDAQNDIDDIYKQDQTQLLLQSQVYQEFQETVEIIDLFCQSLRDVYITNLKNILNQESDSDVVSQYVIFTLVIILVVIVAIFYVEEYLRKQIWDQIISGTKLIPSEWYLNQKKCNNQKFLKLQKTIQFSIIFQK